MEGTPTPNNSGFLEYKTPKFRHRRRRTFQKLRLSWKMGCFLSFKGKFRQILIHIVILDLFGYKNTSSFRNRKLEKYSENFGKFWVILEKNCRSNTPNFENLRKFVHRNAIKYQLWGDIKLKKIGGSHPKKSLNKKYKKLL